MTSPLRILVADDEPLIRQYLCEILPELGHEVVGAAADGAELLQLADRLRPDLIITDIKMPHRDGLDAIRELSEQQATPVILVSAFHDPQLIARADSPYIMAYLVKPVQQADLATAIAIAQRRFEQFQSLSRESAGLRQELADRKLIERAKGILMQRLELSEADAFRRLQQAASDENLKLADVAKKIVDAEKRLGRR